jgi:hypothetical protein
MPRHLDERRVAHVTECRARDDAKKNVSPKHRCDAQPLAWWKRVRLTFDRGTVVLTKAPGATGPDPRPLKL